MGPRALAAATKKNRDAVLFHFILIGAKADQASAEKEADEEEEERGKEGRGTRDSRRHAAVARNGFPGCS